MDRNQAKIYELVANTIMKFLVGASCIVAFFIVLYFFVNAEGTESIAKFTPLQGILGSTFYILIGFYYNNKAPNNKKKPILLWASFGLACIAFIGAGLAIYIAMKK